MKTTLWTPEDLIRAEALLRSIERDVARATAHAHSALERAHAAAAVHARARASNLQGLWIERVRADERSQEALAELQRLVNEVEALNGSVDVAVGSVRWAGVDARRALVYWTRRGHALVAEALSELDRVPTAC